MEEKSRPPTLSVVTLRCRPWDRPFGSLAETRRLFDLFRAKVAAAGFPGLHLNAVVWNNPILPGERVPADAKAVVAQLGFDSVTSYVWIHHYATDVFPFPPGL